MATNDVITSHDHSKQVRIASGVNGVLGLWLIISPWVYGFAATNVAITWNSIIAGVVIALCGFMRVRSPRENTGLSWTNLLLGTWTALSPWIFGYFDGGRLWNSVLIGLAVVVLAIWSGSATASDRRHVHA
jgi:hypothetical protein